MSPLAMLGLGLALGARHATDVDHVAAVTAMASRERTLGGALGLGTLWGIGHMLTVLVVGGAIVAFGLVIPERVGLWLELLVAVMLVTLGLMNFSRYRTHAHAPAEPDPVRRAARVRPLLVGIVHGLAGSAAVALLVLTTIHEPAWALAYLAIFCVGTITSMALLTASIVLPLAALTRRFAGADRYLVRALGVVSIAVGLWLGYQVGFADGLFLGEPLALK